MKKIFLFFILLSLFSCQKVKNPVFPEGNDIVGLAMPLQLNIGGNQVYLTDFFPDPSLIDYLSATARRRLGERALNRLIEVDHVDGSAIGQVVKRCIDVGSGMKTHAYACQVVGGTFRLAQAEFKSEWDVSGPNGGS